MIQHPLTVKEGVIRSAILAQVLEPLALKQGCTTRYTDSSPGTKLEYFLVGAVGAGLICGEVVDRFESAGGQPPFFYDLGFKAQAESARYRGGGKVSSGQIQVLLPLVAAHARWGQRSTREVCEGAVEILSRTGRKDVEYLDQQLELAFSMSKRRTLAGDVYDHAVLQSSSVLEACEKAGHLWITREIATAYPIVQQMVCVVEARLSDGVLRASEEVYNSWRPRIGRADAVADLIVASLYLVFFSNPGAVLVP